MQEKTCRNCNANYILDADDLAFYEKMQVPLPTWCPECQFVRRTAFRNQNTLYKRTSNTPGDHKEKLISIYSENKKVTVYSREYWLGDGWDPYFYGKEVDFSKPFFEQIKELIDEVPWPALMNWNAVNSDYCNSTTDNKNCYLVFGGDFNEDCSYATFNFHSKGSLDLYLVEKCDLCYQCTDSEDCYKVSFAQFSRSCSDCMFMYDCVNCTECIGCVNLRNKSNCIFNQQYTKEEYQRRVGEMHLDTRDGIEVMIKKFEDFRLMHPHKYAHILRSTHCTGDNITNAKNCTNCFDIVAGAEDLKNVFLSGGILKDSRNMSHAGHGSELLYDSLGVFGGCKNVRFSLYTKASTDVTYVYNCQSSSNVFGCVGLRNGKYSILNKRYSKEEYEALVPKIIEHMDKMPYVDKLGREYRFGEFFPTELSPFAYNETIAFDYFPLTREQAMVKGYTWKESEEKDYVITKHQYDLPESIASVDETILAEVIECTHNGECEGHQCATTFRIVPQELEFYKRMNLPLPKYCPNCRHYMRLRSRNPMKLWHRSCMCESSGHDHEGVCTQEFETAYAPERKEIVYCESCYQKEIL